MIKYELAKQLKDAGWESVSGKPLFLDNEIFEPKLSELIEACDKLVGDEDVVFLQGHNDYWFSVDGVDGFGMHAGHGSTPEEAVARLWIELNKK